MASSLVGVKINALNLSPFFVLSRNFLLSNVKIYLNIINHIHCFTSTSLKPIHITNIFLFPLLIIIRFHPMSLLISSIRYNALNDGDTESQGFTRTSLSSSHNVHVTLQRGG